MLLISARRVLLKNAHKRLKCVNESHKMAANPCGKCVYTTGCASDSSCARFSTATPSSEPPKFDKRFVDVLQGGFNPELTKFDRLDDLSDLVSTAACTLPHGQTLNYLVVPQQVLQQLSQRAFIEIMHFLRAEHLQQLRNILDDPESSNNDKFVSMQLLKNACIAAGRVLPGCQDTGTAIVVGKRGNLVVSTDDAGAISQGVYEAYVQRKFRYSQMAPLSMYKEVNTRCNLPAQVELYCCDGAKFELLFIAKGGGSANKTFLYQQTKAVLTEANLLKFLMEQIATIGTSACPPYHLAIVVGGLSAEMTLKTVKLASCHHLDSLPTSGNEYGQAFRDVELERVILKKTSEIGIGAQFGGKYFCHDVRVIRLPRHGASCPIGIGVSCSADRQIVAKIDDSGVYLERLEQDPARFLPEVVLDDDDTAGSATGVGAVVATGTSSEVGAGAKAVGQVHVNLDVGMDKLLQEISKWPIKTRLLLTGTLVVARDIAHAKLDEILHKTGDLPSYFKDHPIYYAGPAKRPDGYVSGSFGPTTAGRMDSYAEGFMAKGASLITLAKGNRSRQFVAACKKYGGVYLGSVGGPAALLAQECIESLEVIDFPELGMEAVHKIRVKNFPAFVVVDAKETTRAGHEDLEYYEKAIAKLLRVRDNSHGARRTSLETAIDNLVVESQTIAKDLLSIYKDEDGLRKEEIRRLAGGVSKDVDSDVLWTNYYTTLKQLRDFYRQNENMNIALEPRTVDSLVQLAIGKVDVDAIFSPEENMGRCLDLLEHFISFVNLPQLQKHRQKTHRQQEIVRLQKRGVKDAETLEEKMAPYVELDYASYISSIDHFHLIPRYCKYRIEEYRSYLLGLCNYLENFFQRQNPLANVGQLMQQFESSFADAWEKQELDHWKEATSSMEFYLKPVDRLFTSAGVFNSFQQGKRYAKIAQEFACKTPQELDEHGRLSREHDRELARLEYMIVSWVKVLETSIERTLDNLHKRESRTSRELEASKSLALQILETVENTDDANLPHAEESGGEAEDEEEERPVYNPLNLPLGYDGKPIPFWLYKLHGLGVEFKCEICGNYSYWGRRAFENHFTEWRHTFGMRCLGIPNTPHFKEITSIQDAFALYERLQTHPDYVGFNMAQEVECEDSEGNVMSARAYEDLRRQGLL